MCDVTAEPACAGISDPERSGHTFNGIPPLRRHHLAGPHHCNVASRPYTGVFNGISLLQRDAFVDQATEAMAPPAGVMRHAQGAESLHTICYRHPLRLCVAFLEFVLGGAEFKLLKIGRRGWYGTHTPVQMSMSCPFLGDRTQSSFSVFSVDPPPHPPGKDTVVLNISMVKKKNHSFVKLQVLESETA